MDLEYILKENFNNFLKKLARPNIFKYNLNIEQQVVIEENLYQCITAQRFKTS